MTQSPPSAAPDSAPAEPCRIIVALGTPQREAAIVAALNGHQRLAVTSQPVRTADLLRQVEAGAGDLAVIGAGLRGLDDTTLAEIRRQLPIVLLVPDPAAERWYPLDATLLPVQSTGDTVLRAVLAVLDQTGGAPTTSSRAAGSRAAAPMTPLAIPLSPPPAPSTAAPAASASRTTRAGDALVLAVIGAKGAPGASTLALNLAAGLSRLRPTSLVDLDLIGPSLASLVHTPVGRNLNTVARAFHSHPATWQTVLDQELVALPRPLADLRLLTGLPHLDARTMITPDLVTRLVAALTTRAGLVILDVGRDLVSTDPTAPAHAQALRLADRVLLVGRGDLTGAYHLRRALDEVTTVAGVPPERLELVISPFDRAIMHDQGAIERTLGRPVAAWIPHDRRRVLLAARQRLPLGLAQGARGPAYRAVREYSEDLAIRLGLLDPETRLIRLWRRLRGRGGRRTDLDHTWAHEDRDQTPATAAVGDD